LLQLISESTKISALVGVLHQQLQYHKSKLLLVGFAIPTKAKKYFIFIYLNIKAKQS
jgi:hypothetical protein